jgi:uncharacterized OB-fold protein
MAPISKLHERAPIRDRVNAMSRTYLNILDRNGICHHNSIVKIVAPPPAICQKCGSHRTRVVDQSDSPKVLRVRCEVCGHVFVPPQQS